MEHYYSEKPESKSEPQSFQVELFGQPFSFMTDVGVFSKRFLDFGTKLLIESFQLPNVQGPLLDVGCGYGPIGVTLAKRAPDRRVVMVDINERAVSLAKQNCQLNDVHNAIVLKSDLFDNVPNENYAAILSNPPIRAGKKVVYQLFEKAHEFLTENGEFWIVIQKKQGAPSAEKKLHAIFGNVDVINKKKGYFIFRSIKK